MVRKTKGLLIVGLFAIIVFIIISVDINATPDKNGDEPGCGEDECHAVGQERNHTYQENTNKQPPYTNLYVDYYNAEGELGVNIILYNNNSDQYREKLEYDNSSGDWKPIKIAAELSDKKDSQVYYNVTGNGPNLIVYAPDEGSWRIRTGYYNKTLDQLFYTQFDIDVKYKNLPPKANASWAGFEGFEVVSGGKGEEDTVVRFPEEGTGKIYFEAEGSTDPNKDDVENLSYYWDFNDKIDANDDGIKTNDNDTGSKGKTDVFHTFNLEDIEIGVKYTITLSVTDNHLYRAWDIDTLNITFLEPLKFPDLNITYAKMNPKKTTIGKPMNIMIKIKNIGDKDITQNEPFVIKILTQDKNLIIPEQTIKANIGIGQIYEYSYTWYDTTKFADGSDVVPNYWYGMEIEVDVYDDITEVQPDGEENNKYFKGNAFRFVEKEGGEVKLEIVEFKWECPNATNEKVEEDDLVYVNVSVKNIGNASAQFIYIKLWDTTKSNPNPKPVSQQSPESLIIKPGGFYNVTFKIRPKITSGESEEEHKLKLKVTYQTLEYNATANFTVKKVTVQSFLFKLGLEYKKYLIEGKVGEELRKAFKDNGYPLSSNAVIKKISDKKWEIVDGEHVYTIEDTGKELKIYGTTKPIKPEREGKDWLKILIPIGAVVAIVVGVVIVISVKRRI